MFRFQDDEEDCDGEEIDSRRDKKDEIAGGPDEEEEIAVGVAGRRDDEEEIPDRQVLTYGAKCCATGGGRLTTNVFQPPDALSGSIMQ